MNKKQSTANSSKSIDCTWDFVYLSDDKSCWIVGYGQELTVEVKRGPQTESWI